MKDKIHAVNETTKTSASWRPVAAANELTKTFELLSHDIQDSEGDEKGKEQEMGERVQ